MRTKLIYLASPYSKYPYGRNAAYEAVTRKAAQLMLEGHLVFAPIPHSHAIEQFMPEIKDGDFWLKQDFAVLAACKELWVYKMPGWDESYGVQKEIEFANNNKIKVKYLDYEPYTGQ